MDKLNDEAAITWEFFGVVEAANMRGGYTSSKIRNGTFYKWDGVKEPLFIIDHDDFDGVTVYLAKTE